MKKDLNYYLNLPYKMEITVIPKEKGGGFEAAIPDLGRYAFVGQGDTIEDAIKDLEETKRENFKNLLMKKVDIPEPDSSTREYRGEFLIRMPKFLHKELAEAAQENGISLNQYMNYLLINNYRIAQIGELLYTGFENFMENVWSFPNLSIELERANIMPLIQKGRKFIGA